MESVIAPYLIDPSDKMINISKTVTNLGRRVDNDVVVDDARVSRQHAQIRLSPRGCILFDLNSTGGTYINDKKITQQKLHSGDVISLAGVIFIYGEESQNDTSAAANTTDHSQTHPPEDQGDVPLEFIG
jgi:pSer/pThr/pTyr-binding forkhead associated (FHA) protein